MAWVRCCGGAKKVANIAYPPADNWTYTTTDGTVTLNDNIMQVVGLSRLGETYFNFTSAPRTTSYSITVTVTISNAPTNGAVFSVQGDGIDIMTGVQIINNTRTFTVTIPANTSVISLKFYNAWNDVPTCRVNSVVEV